MPIGDSLASAYSAAEDAFFNLADWLDEKGIPVYSLINPLEERGVPAFPVVIGIAILLVAGIFFLVLAPPIVTTVSLSLVDDSGNALSGVNLKITDDAGKVLFEGRKSSGETIELQNVPAGSILKFTGSKDGFETGFVQTPVRSERVPVVLTLSKQIQGITAQFRLIDFEKGTPIANAQVTLKWGTGSVRSGQTDSNGAFAILGVPANEPIQVEIVADNYETVVQTMSFAQGSTPSIALVPKTTATFGSANLIIKTFDKTSHAPLDDVLVRVLNPQTDQELAVGRTVNGQFVLDFPKGTIFSIVASKPGFITVAVAEKTLRDTTEERIELEQGGNRLHVTVVDADSNVSVFDSTVTLISQAGQKIEEKKTPFTGSVDFEGLRSDQNYFVTAFKENFVPNTRFVSPFDTAEVTVSLQTQNAENTGTLNVLVSESSGFPANNAGLEFFELIAGKPIPIGIPTAIAAYDGFASVLVPANRIIWVVAQKGLERGDGNVFVEADTQNNLAIRLKPIETAKLLRVLDTEGNPFAPGLALVQSVTGEVLLDENLSEEGTAFFDAKNYKNVEITIWDIDGNSFSQTVNVENKSEIVVQWLPVNADELAPQITFVGITDIEGKTAEGIIPNQDYWMTFQVLWLPGQYRGGIHVRVGNDQTKFADSDAVGITGFDAMNTSSFFYSRSYSAFPQPGNEAADFGNPGKAGLYNKWLELYFNNPKASQLVRVKVRLKEGFDALSFPVHFRSWSNLNGKYFRSPLDTELGNDAFSNTKTALYAQTFEQEISLFANKEQCTQNVCTEYQFLSADGEVFSKDEFRALRGRIYALEVTLRSKQEAGLLLRASTDKKNPKLFFTGSEVETFTEFLDSADANPLIEINDLTVLENSLRTARLYFKPFKAGQAQIKAEVLGENLELKQDFYFNIFEQSEMQLEIEPPAVGLGEPFTVVLSDQNANKTISDATIHVRDSSGSIVASTVGNNSQDNGQNGRYRFSDSIAAGRYTITATAFGFAPAQAELVISATDVLKLPEEINVVIPKNQQTSQASIFLENTSNLTLTDITVEIARNENWPIELDAIGGTSSTLRPRQKATVDITAHFQGDVNKRVSGNGDLIVHATVSGKYPAVATSRLNVSYNEPFDPACLTIDQTQLTVFLAANAPAGPYDSGLFSQYGGFNRAPYYSPFDQDQYYAQPQRYNGGYTPRFFDSSDQFNNGSYQPQSYPETNANSNITNNSSYLPNGYQNNARFPYNNPDPGFDYSYSPNYYQNIYNNSPNSPNYNGYQYPGQGAYGGTGNIFSRVYSNVDQTAKELEIQVTNNCAQALQLSGKAVKKTGTLSNEGIEIVVPSFAVQTGETVPATIRVSNKRDQFLPTQQAHDFDLTLESDSLTKRVPLKVILWDSRFALATRDQIVMFLSQSQKGEPVVTSTPLFLRNVGAEDIDNLRIEVLDSYLEGVSLRVIPFGIVPKLGKGQVVFPPKLVVAEKRGGTDKGRLVHSRLGITGDIDNKPYLLRTIDVWIHVSSLNCLYVTPVDDLEFSSVESRFGVIDKKVRIRNTCEEPVRVVGLEPSKVGASDLFLVPIAGDLLDRDREAEFILRLAKHGDYKNENLGISVAGLTQLTQKFIQSNRLQTQIELGELAVQTGLASEPYSLDVCAEEGVSAGSKDSVRFPKIAKSGDCEKGYCDAVSAAGFLAKKLDDKINQVQNAIGRSNNQIENFIGCVNTAEQKACSFSELGVPSETFDLFLQNDQMSIELLQKEFAEKGPASLKNYGVGYCAGFECDTKSIAQTGFPNFLYVSNLLHGCGKYRIKINGAAFAVQNQIRNDGFILSVNVQNRELTPECTNTVENVMNFLPIDTGLTDSNPVGAWPGIIEVEPKLADVGNAFAQELFGATDGRVSETTGSNKARIQFGEVRNGLIKIEIQAGTISDEPKTVLITINQALNTNQSDQKNLAKEAAQTLSALKKQRIQEGKGCIAKDHSYLTLGSTTKLGDVLLDSPNTINVVPNQNACVDLNVSSPIKEKIQFKTNKSDVLQVNTGIGKIFLTTKDNSQTEISEESATELVFSDKTRKYETTVQLCVQGNDQFALATNAKQLEVTANSASDSLRQSQTKKIAYQVCGIHPYDLVNKMNALSPGEYYATVGWKGEPQTTTLGDVTNALAEQGKLAQTDKPVLGPGIDPTKQKAGQDILKNKRISATLGFPLPGIGGEWVAPWKSYLPSCMAMSAACNGIKTVGFYGWLWGPILDCAVPAAWMIAPDVGGLKNAREFLEQKLGTVSGFIVDKMKSIYPEVFSGTIAEGKEAQFTDAALAGVSAKSLIRGIKYNNYINSRTGRVLADRLAQDIADQVVEHELKGRTGARELRNLVAKELEVQLRDEIKTKYGSSRSYFLNRSLSASDQKLLDEVVANAIKKTELDAKLTDFALKNQTAFKSGSTLANQAGALDNAIANKLGESYGKITAADAAAAHRHAEGIADQIISQSKSTVPSAAERTAMVTRIENTISFGAGAETPGQRAFQAGVDAAPSVTKDGLRNTFKGEVKQLTQNLLSSASTDAGTGFFSRFRKFLGSLGRGVVCGALSNLAGLEASRLTMEEKTPINSDTTQYSNAQPQIGPSGEAVRDDRGRVRQNITLQKGATYKIIVRETKNAQGKTDKTVEVKKIEANEIPAKATSLNTDCKGEFAQRGLDGYAFSFDPKGPSVTQKEQANYSLASKTVDDYATSNGIPQAVLIAALQTEQTIGIPEPCDPTHAWKNNAANADSALSCAAARLKQYYKSESDADLRYTFAHYYDASGNAPEQFISNALATYKQWNGFKIA